jgi:hypothetical protein
MYFQNFPLIGKFKYLENIKIVDRFKIFSIMGLSYVMKVASTFKIRRRSGK